MNKTEELLERSLFSASLLTNQIDDLLDLAKFEESKFKLDYDLFDLTKTIKQVFKQVKYFANKKKIILESNIVDYTRDEENKNQELNISQVHNPEILRKHDKINYLQLQDDDSTLSGNLKLLTNIYGDARRFH